jgi:hypothetical protein
MIVHYQVSPAQAGATKSAVTEERRTAGRPWTKEAAKPAAKPSGVAASRRPAAQGHAAATGTDPEWKEF